MWQHPSFQGWRMGKPRHLENLLFVESLPSEQGFGQQIQLLAMRAEKPLGFLVALTDNLEHLGVDDFSSLLTKRPRVSVTV